MHPACFVHVFKAGGTSVSDWLCEHYPASSVPPDPVAFAENPSAYLDTPLLRGHVFARDVVHLDRVLLTIVRQPEAQLMSALWHYVSGADIDRDHQSFDAHTALTDQARVFAETDAGMQSVWFSRGHGAHEPAPDFLDRIDAIGLTERLPDTLRLFAWKLGLPAPHDIPHARNSGAGASGMPDEIRHILRDQLRIDGVLYDDARRRFDHDFDALRMAARTEADIDDFLDHRVKFPPPVA